INSVDIDRIFLARRRAGEPPDLMAIGRTLRVRAEESASASRRALRTELFFKDSFITRGIPDAEIGLAFELEPEKRLADPILQSTLEVKCRAVELRQAPLDERRFRLRLRPVTREEVHIVGVRAACETDISAIISRPARHTEEIAKMAA